jgi:hypothetical protein
MPDTLSKPETKKGRVQRVVYEHLLARRERGEIPTTGRFVFYELEQAGLARKPDAHDRRPNRRRSIGWPPGAQDVTDALLVLREIGLVPWSWILDEERTLTQWDYAGTIAEWAAMQLPYARLDCWSGSAPPLILCESKATAAVLQYELASRYLTPIAGTKGQARGFLHVEVAPLLRRSRPVLYLGDLDRSGEDIEQNTRRVLERDAVHELDWTRLAMTPAQAADIEPIWKVDGRDGKGHEAWEVESLGQTALVALVRDALDDLLPEPLDNVLERERGKREAFSAFLTTWKEADGAS